MILVAALCGTPPAETAREGEQPSPAASDRLETLAKVGIETALSFLLETRTTVEGVRLDPAAEVLELDGLRIANPKGFDGDAPAFSAQRVRVEAKPEALFSPKAVIRLVEVEGGTVHAQMKIRRGLNLKRLLDSAARFKTPRLLGEKRWIVEKGIMTDCLLRFASDWPPRTYEYPLEPMELSMKGPGGRGVTADKALAEVLLRLIEAIQEANRAQLQEFSGALSSRESR